MIIRRQLTCGELPEPQVLHGTGGDQGFLWVEQTVRQGVHTHVEVGDVHPHSLFTHSRLVGVTG